MKSQMAGQKLLASVLLATCIGVSSVRADSVVVFNEIMYHPQTNESALEWVELYNQMGVDVELSGWSIKGGIDYQFPEGTVIAGRSYLVVALSPASVMTMGVTNVLGPFTGRLSNGGEKLELRNKNDRLMDEVNYGVEGTWPVAPDGAGPSLAKLNADNASGPPASWACSEQIGGTPGIVNFLSREITIQTTNSVLIDSTWRLESSGTDLATGWRQANFDDSLWGSGQGLFYAGTAQSAEFQTIPTLFNTGVDANGAARAPGSPDLHYFLTLSPYSTPPPPAIPATIMLNHPNWMPNDAASLWVGAVSDGSASVPSGTYTYRTTFDLTGFDSTTARITLQVAGDNAVVNVLLNGTTTGLRYTNFTTFSAPFTVSSGFVAGTNVLDFMLVNDVGTGANPSGLRVLASGTAKKFLPLNTQVPLGPSTHYYRKEFVVSGEPAAVGLQIRPVVDDGAVFYLNGVEVLRLNMPEGAVNYSSTALTNITNAVWSGPFDLSNQALRAGTNVLAVEVHQALEGNQDALFGAELSLSVTNYPPPLPPQIAFNEMSSVTNAQFWVELVNHGSQSVQLDSYVLARFGTPTNREYVLPAQTLEAGGYLVLDRAALGFGADPGDRVILYTPGKSNVMDAVVAKSAARARFPEGTGEWLHPSQTSPGTSNVFSFHDEVVINEIMYHHSPLPSVPAVYFTNKLLNITNTWRYDVSGTEPDPAWMAPLYDDSLWPVGRAVFFTNISLLPAPKGTTLPLSNTLQRAITTYYFRSEFVFTNSTAGLELTANPIIDDGAIFYLNGVEVYRYGMPTGAVTTTTRAITNIGAPTWSGPITIPADSIVQGTNVFAVEVHQYLPPPGSKDVAFGVELVATGFITPASPEREVPEAWVELYNRSTTTVDLTGWRITEAINFGFAPGTTMGPGEYLVVANDLAYMRSIYPGIRVVGPFTNKLAHSSDRIDLKDSFGNPADEVRYFDDKPWPEAADGGGSSLELRDPWADNSRPEAWAASSENGKAEWQTVTYRGIARVEPAASPTLWKEFVMGLLGTGEMLLDDIKVVESPAGAKKQLLQNGTFETGKSAWRFIGNHRHGEVIVDPANAANHVLRLVADGDTGHLHNHAETTLANGVSITNGLEYEISFRAKWVSGCNKLNTRLYFNRVARTTELSVPENTGTPGAPNSQLTGNIGPTFYNMAHNPVVPRPSQAVTVQLNAWDPDGVTNATLFYSVNGGTWQSLSMSQSIVLGKSHFSGRIPGQDSGSIVQFYVLAQDGLGVSAAYPAGGANSRALYEVSASPLMQRVRIVRLVMLPADAEFMHAPTNVMSNERLGCTVVTDENRVFYDARIHLQSSQRGRNDAGRVGFTVRLPADNLLRGVHNSFTVDRSGGQSGRGGKHDEILLKHVVNKAGGLPGMYDDLVQFFAPRTAQDGTGLMILAKYGDEFLDTQFKNGGDGELYKLELIYYPTTTVVATDPESLKLPQPDGVVGTDIQDLGSDQEAYRWTYLKENRVSRSDYEPIMRLARTMSLTGTNFAHQIHQVMDVDEWLRAVAFLGLIGGDDIYTYGNSHNLIIYFRPTDLRGMAFLWDMDYSFMGLPTKPFLGTGSATTYKLITGFPDHYRRYMNHLLELSNLTGDSAYMGEWANRYGGALGQNWNGVVDYLSQRAAFVRSSMPLTTPFTIANNGGDSFSTTNSEVTLTGSAPMTVKDIEVNGIRLPLTWTTLTDWKLTIPLPFNVNVLNVQGLDNYGRVMTNASLSITITNIGAPALKPVVINEWMADNAAPGGYADPADDRWQDWFELYNPNDVAVNLSGYYLTDALTLPTQWTIPANTFIGPRGFLLIWADDETSQNGTGSYADLHANFKLSNGGEAIGLYAPDGTRQHALYFGGQHQNVSQGLFPDGDTNAVFFMTNWTPRLPNTLGVPPAPSIGQGILDENNRIAFSVPGIAERTYRVDYKDALESALWTPLATNRVVNGLLWINDGTGASRQRFYRVVLLQ